MTRDTAHRQRRPTSVATLVLAGAACTADAPPRWLIVDERAVLCAAAPDSNTPLDRVQATQWRVAIEVGELALPSPQPLPDGLVSSAEYSPLPPLLDVRDVDGTNPFDAVPQGAVLEDTNLAMQPDDATDVLVMRTWLDTALAESGSWALSLAIEAPSGDDFRSDGPSEARFACDHDVWQDSCPNRAFMACNPGGPTVRTRVTLDRGELVLDVRYVEGMHADGESDRVMFVAAEVRVDDVVLVQDDFFDLLYASNDFATIGDGAYAVLAPELLGDAGLGCGVAVVDVGSATPRASTVDCDLREVEPLVIVEVVREVLP